jgi:ribosomal protein L24
MFDRFLHRGLRIGAEVTILAGPYTGHVGRISQVDQNGRFRVFIDDCCQPVLDASNLTTGKPRNVADRSATA